VNPIRWAKNVLKVLDVALNVVVLFSARVETLSRRAGRARNEGKRWGCVLCRVLDAIQRDHCTRAVQAGEIF